MVNRETRKSPSHCVCSTLVSAPLSARLPGSPGTSTLSSSRQDLSLLLPEKAFITSLEKEAKGKLEVAQPQGHEDPNSHPNCALSPCALPGEARSWGQPRGTPQGQESQVRRI